MPMLHCGRSMEARSPAKAPLTKQDFAADVNLSAKSGRDTVYTDNVEASNKFRALSHVISGLSC